MSALRSLPIAPISRVRQRAKGRHAEVNSDRGVSCSGPPDLRAQVEDRSALRLDTPAKVRAMR
jgi:hypothetical protein